ncbi:MAG: N-acetyl-gamma-glutamyl-phosphate reductase [Bacteriovoracaceae bacterium]
MTKKSVAVIGARGYSGLELCKLLQNHPEFDLQYVTSSNKDWKLSDDLNLLEDSIPKTLDFEELLKVQSEIDLIFMAQTAGQSFKTVEKIGLFFKGCLVDLSGAFRLSKEESKKYYGLDHTSDSRVNPNVYGLSPFQTEISGNFISNPGCYPTASLLPLIPLLKNDLIETENIIIDAKSGTSGAGRTPKDSTHFNEIGGNLLPYKIGHHQHTPEIKRYLEHFSGRPASFTFTTTLVPIERGILASIYAKKKEGITIDNISSCLKETYASYNLVEVINLNDEPQKQASYLSLKKIQNTSKCRMSFTEIEDRLILFSQIDNLRKGAASQAIENANRYFQLPLSTGLL